MVMRRLGTDGPRLCSVTAWISRLSLMDAVAAIRHGDWSAEEFSASDGKCFEEAAQMIRDHIDHWQSKKTIPKVSDKDTEATGGK